VLWVFGLLGLVIVVVIGLVVLGRETAQLSTEAMPAVFDMAQAVEFIADRLPQSAQARLSHDDVRWILLADADFIETAELVDEDLAVARLLELGDESGRELEDEDVVAVLNARMAYLAAIGAIGPLAQ